MPHAKRPLFTKMMEDSG